MFTIDEESVVADPIALFADRAYAHTSSIGLFGAWIGVFAYALQLYFDFSGYSDMAIGLARMASLGGWPVRMLIKHGLLQIGSSSEQIYSFARFPLAASIIFAIPNSKRLCIDSNLH